VRLAFGSDTVALTVDNAAAGRPIGNIGNIGNVAAPAGNGVNGNGEALDSGGGFLALSGGGYGLRGIAERVALLGGHVEAGPTAEGWRVEAVVPLAPVTEEQTVRL
jgi:hypothetical protein